MFLVTRLRHPEGTSQAYMHIMHAHAWRKRCEGGEFTSPMMSVSSLEKLSPSRESLTSSLSSLRGTAWVSLVALSPVVAEPCRRPPLHSAFEGTPKADSRDLSLRWRPKEKDSFEIQHGGQVGTKRSEPCRSTTRRHQTICWQRAQSLIS